MKPDRRARRAQTAEIAEQTYPEGTLISLLSFIPCAMAASPPPRIPLVLWTSPEYPAGLSFGLTNGISAGDVNGDGWVDAFTFAGKAVWMNDGGTSFYAVDLSDVLSDSFFTGYGGSLADFDRDGFAEIATEPRGGDCVQLLDTTDGFTWTNATLLFDTGACGDSETLAWGDVDGDGWLDLFVPLYPYANPGNRFYRSLGPDAYGVVRFTEEADEAGIYNPVATTRPEGVQFLDVDGDGDLDVYSNGVIYQNVTDGAVFFDVLTPSDTGIGNAEFLDEGAAFGDFDLDGDFDLAVAYAGKGTNLIWLARGDGSFYDAGEILEDQNQGATLGLSIEDWDHDGDLDFTTREVFRVNQLVETGTLQFLKGENNFPENHVSTATPAWVDFDRDGDLDSFLGNWTLEGHLYENTTYGADTPTDDKRTVRIRVLSDDLAHPEGLETEFGAQVEVIVRGDAHRYRRFVASGSGYLNQNEYTLTFTLPAADATFDVSVDFPTRPADGLWRVDGAVNPALRGLTLASLAEREVAVFRSGWVHIDGAALGPAPEESPRLVTAGGALVAPAAGVPLSAPIPDDARWVGLEFTTEEVTRLREFLVDGQPSAPVTCDADTGNVMLWDVTDPDHPWRVPGYAWTVPPVVGNHRHTALTDVLLPAGHRFRWVVRVESLRGTNPAPTLSGPARLVGGFAVDASADPCASAAIGQAAADADFLWATVRWSASTADAPVLTAPPVQTDTGTTVSTDTDTRSGPDDTGAGDGGPTGCGCANDTSAVGWIAAVGVLFARRRVGKGRTGSIEDIVAM